MTCQGCSPNTSSTSSAQSELLTLRDPQVMAAFNAFWPKGSPFPPALPWVGTLLSRSGAYYWISAFPETARAVAQAPSYQAIAGFISWSLNAEAAEGERKKKCKKKGPEMPELPDDIGDDLPSETIIGYRICYGCGASQCCQDVYQSGKVGDCQPCPMV